MPRGNERKKANDSEIISNWEVWSAIRYLDPESESDRRQSDVAAAIALMAIVCIVCMVIALLRLRGL